MWSVNTLTRGNVSVSQRACECFCVSEGVSEMVWLCAQSASFGGKCNAPRSMHCAHGMT